MIRINTNRFTHTVRQTLQRLPFQLPVHKLKSLLIIVVLTVLAFQFVVLSTPNSVRIPYYSANEDALDAADKVFVVDKSTATSSHYKHLLTTYSEKFPTWPTAKKCQTYFDELYKLDDEWEVLPPSMDTNDYKKESFDHDGFIKNKITEYKKEQKQEPSDGKKAEFELEFQEILAKTLTTEQYMVDAVTHLRVFGQCYMQDKTNNGLLSNLFGSSIGDTSKSDTDIDMCYDVEHRLFPWLSRELPTFKRWDGTSVKGIPKMSNYISDYDYDDQDMVLVSDTKDADALDADGITGTAKKLFKRASPTRDACFLNQWRLSLNGKGLVLSVADKYEHDLSGLIRVLRALNNRLPIQLVHKGDLSQEVQDRLTSVARSDEFEVPLEVYGLIKGDIPHNFPKQEIWFVNAKRCIKKEYQNKFNGFSNKLIAYLFNSFDEILLMDTDSIPLVKPSTFFDLGPYQRTQTVFFKDRFNAEKVAQHDSDFFIKLMPNSIDEVLFDIPRAGNLTLHNRYIKNQYRHLMEAGVVAIKRSTHFVGILTSIQINFWAATSSRIWGDKELFWLGQSASGNEKYEFNKYDVVSVGEMTPMSDRPRNTIAHELCSTHPGHLNGDDNHTLLWINSGMRYCKVSTWDKDIEHDRIKKNFASVEDLEKYYTSPLRINAALIPPGGDRILNNDKNEPARGWVMNNVCKGYLWCAYDVVGASTDERDRGAYVEYDNITEHRNYYLGKLWLEQDLVKMKEYDLKMDEHVKELEVAKKKKIESEKAKKEQEEREKKEKEEQEKKELEEKAKKEKDDKEKEEKAKKEKEAKEKEAKEKQEKEAKEKEAKEKEAKEKEVKEKEDKEKENGSESEVSTVDATTTEKSETDADAANIEGEDFSNLKDVPGIVGVNDLAAPAP